MIFDRISLAAAYGALKIVELNDGPVKDIIFNKTAWYGTKTVIRFKTLAELRDFINENYPFYYYAKDCQCATGPNEAIWTLLSFNLKLNTGQRYATFVNNLRGGFESAQEAQFNKTSVDALARVFRTQTDLLRLKENYSCFAYILNQNRYIDECEYIELITNKAYDDLMYLYSKMLTSDLSVTAILVNRKTYDPEPLPEISCSDFKITDTLTTPSLVDNICDGLTVNVDNITAPSNYDDGND